MATQAEIAVLRGTATQVKNESQVGGNTAGRVGGLFEGIVDALPSDEVIDGKISEAVNDIQPIEITGDVTNAPDEEDLTSENQGGTDVLKFKDKAYNAALYSGLGRVYLRKNIVTLEGTGKNVLTQAMVNTANTIYHIQYDYDLNGQTITLPAGCVLEFDGGSVKNGTINGDQTCIFSDICKIFDTTISIGGSWNIDKAYPEWFGAKGDGTTDDYNALQHCLNYFNSIFLNEKVYLSNSSLVCNRNSSIKGKGFTSALKAPTILLNTRSVVSDVKLVYYPNSNAILTLSENIDAAYCQIKIVNIFIEGSREEAGDLGSAILIKPTDAMTAQGLGLHGIIIDKVFSNGYLREGIKFEIVSSSNKRLWISDVRITNCFFYSVKNTITSVNDGGEYPIEAIMIENVQSQNNNGFTTGGLLVANVINRWTIMNSFMWDYSGYQYQLSKNSSAVDIDGAYKYSINLYDYVDSQTDGSLEILKNNILKNSNSSDQYLKIGNITPLTDTGKSNRYGMVRFGAVTSDKTSDILGSGHNGLAIEITNNGTLSTSQESRGLFINTLGSLFTFKVENGIYKLYQINSVRRTIRTASSLPTPNTDNFGGMIYKQDIKQPVWSDGVYGWRTADGVLSTHLRKGRFAQKPLNSQFVPIGATFLCTNRAIDTNPTSETFMNVIEVAEDTTKGLLITHCGDGVWVDALGRVVS